MMTAEQFLPEYIEICRKLPPRDIRDYDVGDWFYFNDDTRLIHMVDDDLIGDERSIYSRDCLPLHFVDGCQGPYMAGQDIGKELGTMYPQEDIVWLPHCVQQWMEMEEWSDRFTIRKESWADRDTGERRWHLAIIEGDTRIHYGDPLLACAKAIEKIWKESE